MFSNNIFELELFYLILQQNLKIADMETMMKSRERYYISYKDKTTNKFGLRDKETNEKIIEASEDNGFTSLLPSRHNAQYGLPIVATYNKYGDNGVIVRGVIAIKDYNSFEEIKLPDTYNFIDGFDGGLARVYKTKDGKKMWGIIGLNKVNDTVEVKELVAPKYDNIWNFYDKRRSHVPAEKNDVTEDISLEALREFINAISDEQSIQEEPNSIGIIEMTNYKRFKETTPVNLSSRITFIVGKNNAGKSTFLDALDKVAYNMYHLHFTREGEPFFCFDRDSDDYGVQAEKFKLYHNIYNPNSQSIEIQLTAGQWNILLSIKNNAVIDVISFTNTINASKLVFCKDLIIIEVAGVMYKKYRRSELEKETPEYYEHTIGFDMLISPLLKALEADEKNNILSKRQSETAINMIMSIDNTVTICNDVERLNVFASIATKKNNVNPLPPDIMHSIQPDIADKIIRSFKRLPDPVLGGIIGYYENDWNNDEKIFHQFIKKWLTIMEMGDDFVICKDHADNSYTIQITDNDGTKTDLCDMGSGTIHFVTLCLQLMLKVDDYAGNAYSPMILIEEPEQNLHPMLQSHMADFLLDVSDLFLVLSSGKYRIKDDSYYLNQNSHSALKMVIETHSEYIIRRSQVLAKDYCKNGGNISDFAFRTYYFPSKNDKKKKPYDMKYCKDGRFYERFGYGFFDEATELAMQVF